jgi:hypothetical protein
MFQIAYRRLLIAEPGQERSSLARLHTSAISNRRYTVWNIILKISLIDENRASWMRGNRVATASYLGAVG